MKSLALTVAGHRAAKLCRQGLMIAGLAAALAGCKTTAHDTTGGIANDYRDRHPIGIKEGKKTLTLFVGPGRGGLSATQRAEVLAFAQNWKRDASGGVTIDRPVGGPNQRAINDTRQLQPKYDQMAFPRVKTFARLQLTDEELAKWL